jgi:uncharacterized protein
MPLLINIKQIEDENERLAGELPVSELAFDFDDEVVKFTRPLTYRLEAQHLQDSLLVSGDLELPVECACIRCLKPMNDVISIRDWNCHIPLEGEDCPIIVRDSVDLTPYIREDMVLALPTHPVCRSDCPGLTGKTKIPLRAASSNSKKVASPWDVLNKLKLEP